VLKTWSNKIKAKGKKKLLRVPHPKSPITQSPNRQILVHDDRETPSRRPCAADVEDDNKLPAWWSIMLTRRLSSVCGSGRRSALELMRQYNPQAMMLDLGLPGMSGWEVLDAVKPPR